jgi:transposase
MTYTARRRRRARIARAVKAGLSVREAMARFDVSEFQVYRACREAGLKFGGGGVGRRAQTARRDQAIAAAAKRGESLRSIASRLRMRESTVRWACIRQGVISPKKGSHHERSLAERRAVKAQLQTPLEVLMPRSAPHTRRIVRLMLDTDWTMARIAGACGVPGQRVNSVWRSVMLMVERAPTSRSLRMESR